MTLKGKIMPSPVLYLLKDEKKMPPLVACRDCKFATWMEFKLEVKAYCGVTHAFMFQTGQRETDLVLGCDRPMMDENGNMMLPSKPETELKALPSAPASLGLDKLSTPANPAEQDIVM